MYRRELLILGAVAATIFAVIFGVGFFCGKAVQDEAEMVVLDTLPGLVNAGEAITKLEENWQNANRLISLDDPQERLKLISRIHANSTTELWQRYANAIYNPADRALYTETVDCRAQYLALLEKYYDLVNRHDANAGSFIKSEITPIFLKYRKHAIDLFQLSRANGEARAHRITQIIRWLPLLVSSFCLIIFSAGLIVGLKGAFGSLVLIHQLQKSSKPRRFPENSDPS